MRHYCKMGIGSEGLIKQRERKPKSSRGSGERAEEIMAYFYAAKSDEKKLFLPEDPVEIMKHMNPQLACQFSTAKRRLVRAGFARKHFFL